MKYHDHNTNQIFFKDREYCIPPIVIQGLSPAIQSGNRFSINADLLTQILNSMRQESQYKGGLNNA